MLVNLNDVLLDAKRRKYGVGLFNAVNLELARGIIQAAEQTGSPVIMGTAEVLFPYGRWKRSPIICSQWLKRLMYQWSSIWIMA